MAVASASAPCRRTHSPSAQRSAAQPSTTCVAVGASGTADTPLQGCFSDGAMVASSGWSVATDGIETPRQPLRKNGTVAKNIRIMDLLVELAF